MPDSARHDYKKGLALLLAAVAAGALIVYLFVLPLYSQPEDGETFLVLSTGEAIFYDNDSASDVSPPPARSDQWRLVEFPLHWRHAAPGTRYAWYRFDLEGQRLRELAGDRELLGVFIWRFNQTADVWFNGEKIGSGGRTEEPAVRYWNSPLYFTIPSALIRSKNELQIKHIAKHEWGSMETIILGSDPLLRPYNKTRNFIQHDLSFGLFVFLTITGIFSAAVWYFGRREAPYLWFAIASVGSSIFCINQFVRHLWIDTEVWRWITNVSVDLWAYGCLLFILRSLDIRHSKLEKGALGYLMIGIPVYFYASFFQAFEINIYFHAGSIIMIAYALWLSGGHFLRTGILTSAIFTAGMLLGVIAGLHDFIVQTAVNAGWYGQGFRHQFNVLHMVAPLAFLALGMNLVKEFITSLNAADELNAELEQRVADARAELAEQYHFMEDALVKQSASKERERIYRDLHDDVGSKLLSLYYRLENGPGSTLAKSALEDLRDIVSSRSLENSTLSSAVQQWHSEALGRAQDAGVRLDWHFEPSDQNPILGNSQHAQLRRMLREVLSNAILHNEDITRLDVQIRHCEGMLTVLVENDGVEVPSTSWQPGRGISNLRHRSMELNGDVSITDLDGRRVQVTWSIPLDSINEQD